MLYEYQQLCVARSFQINISLGCWFSMGACWPEMVSFVLLGINQPAAPPSTIPPTTVAMMRST